CLSPMDDELSIMNRRSTLSTACWETVEVKFTFVVGGCWPTGRVKHAVPAIPSVSSVVVHSPPTESFLPGLVFIRRSFVSKNAFDYLSKAGLGCQRWVHPIDQSEPTCSFRAAWRPRAVPQIRRSNGRSRAGSANSVDGRQARLALLSKGFS